MCSSFTDGAAALVLGRPSSLPRLGAPYRRLRRPVGKRRDRLPRPALPGRRCGLGGVRLRPRATSTCSSCTTPRPPRRSTPSNRSASSAPARPDRPPWRATPASTPPVSSSTPAAASSAAVTRSAPPASPRSSSWPPSSAAGPAHDRWKAPGSDWPSTPGGIIEGDAAFVGIHAVAPDRPVTGINITELGHRRPRQDPDQRRPLGPPRHERRVDRRAHRHPGAAHRRHDVRAGHRGRQSRRWPGPGSPPTRSTSSCSPRRRPTAWSRQRRPACSTGSASPAAPSTSTPPAPASSTASSPWPGLIATGSGRILLIGSDTLSRITDLDDRKIAMLVGDGAGAVVLEPVDGPGDLMSWNLNSDGSLRHLLRCDHGGTCPWTARRSSAGPSGSSSTRPTRPSPTPAWAARHRPARPPPGQPADHPGRLPAPRHPRRADRGRHRPLRQHVVGVHPARPRRRPRPPAASTRATTCSSPVSAAG